jgi:hypothetical protein
MSRSKEMIKMTSTNSRLISTLSVFAVIALGAPLAFGQAIQACRNSANGQLRQVETPADCKNNETPVTWNIVGPQGPAGPTGATGAAGSTGATGQQGSPGTPGISGYEIVRSSMGGFGTLVAAFQSASQTAACPSPKVVLGGGCFLQDNAGNLGTYPFATSSYSYPSDSSHWVCVVQNISSDPTGHVLVPVAFAICGIVQ